MGAAQLAEKSKDVLLQVSGNKLKTKIIKIPPITSLG